MLCYDEQEDHDELPVDVNEETARHPSRTVTTQRACVASLHHVTTGGYRTRSGARSRR
jgi:hypothetical protein